MRRIHCALPMQNCPTFFNQNHKRGGSPSALVVKKPACSGEISRRFAVIQTFQPFFLYMAAVMAAAPNRTRNLRR
jgi:hypothetical protein